MKRYSIEPRTRKCIKGDRFLLFAKKELNTCKQVVNKACTVLGNKIADNVTKSNDNNNELQEPVEEIIIPPEKREEILNKMREVL